ncbi:MAG TPA: protein kinase, partial [Anaerolineales bacterium]|nr:protein kinase [Anaerolineales bacterium]
ILLEKHGFDYSVKLVDFGLARPLGDAYLPNESSLAGTVFYLAPELIDGQLADARSDLYALGILLYEMIVGRVPFSDIDEAAIQLQHQQQPAPPPSQSRPNVPADLDTLVLSLLEKKPQDRPESAQKVLEILGAIRFDKPTTGNLPPNIPDFAGGDPLAQLLIENSLVTLIDNDLSLALSAASHLAGQFSDGVWVVDLEKIQMPADVIAAVYSSLDINENPNRPPVIALIEFLREKNLLLLLAHCGHVSGACAQLVAAITSSCPDVRIMAVSDKPLNLPDEKIYSTQSKIL